MSQIINDVFLPASTDLIAGLVAQYRATKASMEELVDVFKRPDINTALGIFIEAAAHDERGGYHRPPSDLFDRILMNPPFSDGRWQAHLQHAAKFLATGGRLVAILPASARNANPLPHLQCEWHGPYDNQFPDASVSVVILVAQDYPF